MVVAITKGLMNVGRNNHQTPTYLRDFTLINYPLPSTPGLRHIVGAANGLERNSSISYTHPSENHPCEHQPPIALLVLVRLSIGVARPNYELK